MFTADDVTRPVSRGTSKHGPSRLLARLTTLQGVEPWVAAVDLLSSPLVES